MAWKPPNTLDNYLIGKYPGGETVYLVSRQAYSNYKNHNARISILTVTGNQYPISSSIKVFEFYDMSQECRNIFERANPQLLKQFDQEGDRPCKPKAVKSEPTPDDYYIVKYNMPTWYIAKRSEYDGGKKEVPAMFWTSKDGKYPATVGTESAKGNPHRAYKFPQLSSEVKAELQKLNPERYKEWEEFYMKKYPNFKPLKPVFEFGNDPSLWQIQNNGNGHFVFLRHLHSPTVWKSQSKSLLTEYPVADHHYLQKDFTNWPDATEYTKQCLKDYQPELYKQFEQYYSELEQRKVAEKQTKPIYKRPDPFIPSNIMMVSSAEKPLLGWTFIDAKLWNSLEPNDKYSACGWVATNRFTKARAKGEAGQSYLLSEADTDRLESLRIKNSTLYNLAFSPQVGSDLDIDAMTEQWKERVKVYQSLGEQAHQAMSDSIGISKTRGKEALHWSFEEAGSMPKGLHMGTPYYSIGVDPYKPTKDESTVSIWGKDLHGKLVNRLSELEVENAYSSHLDYWRQHARISPKDYYELLMNSPDIQGVTWLKPRKVGQTKFYEEVQKIAEYYGRPIPQSEGIMTQINKQYSPNLKQQNDEIINVPTKIIAVTSGQKCTGNSVSSIRRAPTVTEKHTGNRPEPCRGKESSRGCKIG